MTKFLCFGSLNIDKVFLVDEIVKKGETISSTGYAEYSGGKGANQSLALSRACSNFKDTSVHHAGCVGHDGLWLVKLLESNNISASGIHVSETHASGCAIIQRDATGDNAIVLVAGANAQISETQIDTTLAQYGAGDWLIVQNEVSHVPLMIRAARQRGMRVAYNPAPVGSAESLAQLPLDCVEVLVANESEARVLGGAGITGGGAAAAALLIAHPAMRVVVVTLGDQGVVAAFRDFSSGIIETAKVDALRDCAVVDTTGAGDMFVGYFVVCMTKYSVTEALEIAAVASGMACETNGAAPSIPWMDAVQERRRKNRV